MTGMALQRSGGPPISRPLILARPSAATKGVPLALPVSRVVSTGGASGTRKTC